MKIIVAGVSTMAAGAIIYPFWPETAVLGPLWSSVVMAGIGLSIVIGGILLSMKQE